ncbi:MAG: transposase [Gemmataceae bacterium]|nr:transposase [Gemmataceae bacterium]
MLDPERMLATEVFPTEDGHAQERSPLAPVLESVQPKDLWIADRNFCTLKFLGGIARRGAYFLIRQHGTAKGRLIGQRREIGRCPTGMVYEQAIELRDPSTGDWARYRRITVKLDQATRNGDDEIHLLSNVPESDADALRLAELYSKRWTIETVFQEVTTTLQCEIHTLGYPKAALFAFSLALVAYNAVALLKATLRSVHGTQTVNETVSSYYLNLEIRGTYDGMMIAIPESHWKIVRTLRVPELVQVLQEAVPIPQTPAWSEETNAEKRGLCQWRSRFHIPAVAPEQMTMLEGLGLGPLASALPDRLMGSRRRRRTSQVPGESSLEFAWVFDPGGTDMPGHAACRHGPRWDIGEGSRRENFRGSMSRLSLWLSTQDSPPAAGQLYRAGLAPAGFQRKVSESYSLHLILPRLAQCPRFLARAHRPIPPSATRRRGLGATAKACRVQAPHAFAVVLQASGPSTGTAKAWHPPERFAAESRTLI